MIGTARPTPKILVPHRLQYFLKRSMTQRTRRRWMSPHWVEIWFEGRAIFKWMPLKQGKTIQKGAAIALFKA
jgi:hypothetical protein